MVLDGILVPVVTPFNAKNEVDLAQFTQLLHIFIEKGVSDLVICGTTREYYAPSENTSEKPS